jgi:phage baseplate assembly protein W
VFIDFPIQLDSRGRTATADENKHVRDMIEQLIFTNPGERVNRPDFGSGVLQLIFAPNSPELAATVQCAVEASVGHWLGDLISVTELTVVAVDSRLTVEMTYVIRRTGQQQTAGFARDV